MPIRMTDDPQEEQPQYNNNDDSGGGGGGGGFSGGGGLLGLLPLVFTLFRSKTGIVILLLGGLAYFIFGRGNCNMASSLSNNSSGQLKTGGILDPEQFSKASIYEPLTEDNTKNPLPESANLQKYAPNVGNQGHQGSCVAWSSAYAARSILESARTGQPG